MCLKKEQLFVLTAVFFTLAAVLHVLRLVLQWRSTIGGWEVPFWLSGVGVVIAGYLAYEFWRMKK